MEVIVQCQYEENMTLPTVRSTDEARRVSGLTLQVPA